MNTGVVVVAGVAVAVVVGGVVYVLRSRPQAGERDASLPPPPPQVSPSPMAGYSGGGTSPPPQGGRPSSTPAPATGGGGGVSTGGGDFGDVWNDVMGGIQTGVATVNGVVNAFNSIGTFFANLNVGA